MRILIVDDRADTKCRGIIEKCVERGIEVEVKKARNPALCRIFCEEEKIDGIVLDMGLPIYEGKQVQSDYEGEFILSKLARMESEIPVLIFSDTTLRKPYYNHIFDQMTDWYIVQEAEKFDRFLEEVEKAKEEQP